MVKTRTGPMEGHLAATLMGKITPKLGSVEADYPDRSVCAPRAGLLFKARVWFFGLARVWFHLEWGRSGPPR